VDIYLRCAATCRTSFRAQGADLVVVTNAASKLRERCERLGLIEQIQLREHRFHLEVPEDLKFFEAHYKLDLFDAFGRGEFGANPTLVDLDTVLLRPLRAPAGLGLYDITSHVVPAYSEGRIRKDLQNLAAVTVETVRWFGGEFISAAADTYRRLSTNVRRLWPRYLDIAKSLHHVGDEMVVNAALQPLMQDGFEPDDFGTSGDVSRWWSARTLSKLDALGQVKGTALLHLPADKKFLAHRRLSEDHFTDRFFTCYVPYARRRIAVRKAASVVDRIRGKSRLFVPMLE